MGLHHVRPSALVEESIFSLDHDGLTHTLGGRTTHLRLEDLRRIHLVMVRGRSRTNHTCYVTGSSAVVAISSSHYVSFGHFDDRVVTYSPLVRELCARLADRPDVTFVRGKGILAFGLGLAVCLGGCALVGSGLLLGPLTGCPALLALPILLLATALWVVETRPGRFDPRSVPDDLCPVPVVIVDPRASDPVPDSWHDNFESQSERAWSERDD